MIANPPYVDIKALPKKDVSIYFEKFKTTENRINLYSIFLEKSSYLLNQNGSLCFINPNSLLINESYRKIRFFLIDEVYKIIKLPDSIFETATVETMIIFTSKKANCNNIQGAYFNNNDKINFNSLNFNIFFRENWKNDKENRFNIFSNPKTLELLTKIEQNSKQIDEYVLTSLGITPYDKYKGHSESLINNRKFHSNSKLSVEYVPLISGKNIHRYHLSTEIKEYLKYGNWLGAPREEKFFTSPKIIVRQILSGRNLELISAYSEESIYFTQIGFSLISKNNDSDELKFLIALINSKLLSYYHKNKFLDIEKIVFQKVLIANCKRLPIKNDNSIVKKNILNLVNEILNNPKKSTDIEQQIDNLVYKLYDLTYHEVLIIDSTFGYQMSFEEYENLKVK